MGFPTTGVDFLNENFLAQLRRRCQSFENLHEYDVL